MDCSPSLEGQYGLQPKPWGNMDFILPELYGLHPKQYLGQYIIDCSPSDIWGNILYFIDHSPSSIWGSI